jgi:hypothetical protein
VVPVAWWDGADSCFSQLPMARETRREIRQEAPFVLTLCEHLSPEERFFKRRRAVNEARLRQYTQGSANITKLSSQSDIACSWTHKKNYYLVTLFFDLLQEMNIEI